MSDNLRISEIAVMAVLIAIGTPLCVHLGVTHGYQTAAKLYGQPVIMAEPTTVSAQAETNTAVAFTVDNIAQGEKIYALYCVTCHGAKGDGQGPAAPAMVPPPRNFHDAKSAWTSGSDPQSIFQSISKGTPGTAMMGFESALSESQRWQLVRFIQSLRGDESSLATASSENEG